MNDQITSRKHLPRSNARNGLDGALDVVIDLIRDEYLRAVEAVIGGEYEYSLEHHSETDIIKSCERLRTFHAAQVSLHLFLGG